MTQAYTITRIMSDDEFRHYIKKLWEAHGCNYVLTARTISKTSFTGKEAWPSTIRQVIYGGKSPTLRKIMGIKKEKRVRICFETSAAEIRKIKRLCKTYEATKRELLKEMIIVYTSHKYSRTKGD